MKQLFFIYIIQTVCLIAANAVDADNQKLSEILSESHNLYKQCEAISQQRNAATEELDKQLRYIPSKINWLKHLPFDEEQISNCTDNITMAKNRIEVLKSWIEFSKITDPNKRAELVQKYENDRRRILAEELEAGKPFRERTDKLKQEFSDKQKLFETAMKSYCLLPTSEYPSITATSVDARFHSGSATYKWLDKDKKQLGWARISIKEKPVFGNDVEMFGDKFFVTNHLPNIIEVWAGNFRVELSTAKSEWFEKERIVKLVKDFIDLEGLAKIDPRGNSSLDTLVRDSLACSKRYHIIQKERRIVVKPLTDERVKIKALKYRLKEPPADSEQLKKYREEIDFWVKELEDYRGRLEIGTMTDPNERAAMAARLKDEEKKLGAERKRTAKPYDDQYKKLTRGIKEKGLLLNNAMKGFFLEEASRYEGISEITTRAEFSKAAVYGCWKDAQGNTLCSVQLEFRNPPEMPENAPMLDGAYYISDGGDDRNFIWVWAGDFHVSIVVNKEEWLKKEKVSEILKNFIDLPGLAAAYTD